MLSNPLNAADTCKHYEKAEQPVEVEGAIKRAVQSIQLELKAELQSNLMQASVAQLNFNGKVSATAPTVNLNDQQVQGQVVP